MKNKLLYKGYVGGIEFSEPDGLYYGTLLGIRAIVDYFGETLEELMSDFCVAVDDYLIYCEQDGELPEIPFAGDAKKLLA